MSDAFSSDPFSSGAFSSPDTQLATTSQEAGQLARSMGEQFLRLSLPASTTALLPIQQTTEVLPISTEQIVSIPHMPAWVMGVYNWRGEILWMVDLGHLCGLSPWYQQTNSRSTYAAVVLQIYNPNFPTTRLKGQLGLIVNAVETIEWCQPDLIQPLPPAAMNSAIAPFLQGYWWKTDDEMLAILDGTAILQAMPQV